MTVRSGLAVAVRRNVGNASAKDSGSYMLVDMSQQTVCRWEVRLAASLISSARAFHTELYEEPSSGGGRVSVFSYSTDATNTNIWHQAKLHSLHLSTFIVDDVDVACKAKFRSVVRTVFVSPRV